MTHIPAFYRIFFLYIDPLICLSSIHLFFFSHSSYITNGTPRIISAQITDPNSLSPLEHYLLTALGAYSLCIFALQILLLQIYRDVKIWKVVIFAVLLTDLALVWDVWHADPNGFWELGKWTSAEWGNNGILGGLIVIRSAFLLGVGGLRS